MKTLCALFFTFAKIGGFTFGGGYAMLELMKTELCHRHKWCSEEELLDYFAISQCTPGVIAVNTATFVGKKVKGILGGILATLGVVAPSILIIILIAGLLENFAEYDITQNIFAGIRIMVAVLVLNAVFTMGKGAVKDKICLAIAAVSCVVSFLFSVSPIWLVLAGTALGLLLKGRNEGGMKK